MGVPPLPFRYRDAVHRWMFEAALPRWAEHGLDRVHGGYVEQMTLDGRDAAVAFKRTRVTARQIYVFSHGHMLGFSGGVELARHGLDFLTTKTWNGPDKGFARRLTREGGPLDPTPDLYDIAFCLFAFAWFHKATGDKSARDWLHRTLDFVETHMRHPSGLGFQNELPPKDWRQQNPHMHLTEAMLAAFEATGEKRFESVAREIAGLFQTKFFDLKSGTLGEFFTDDLVRAPGDPGRHVEPGHQFEWAWILNSCRRHLGMNLSAEIRATVGFAEAHGVDPGSFATYNVIHSDGSPVDRGSRTWPNCERLKAAIALQDLDGTDPTRVLEESCGLLLDRYLAHRPTGTWIDTFDADGKPATDTIPASTLYHVFLAFTEVLRVCDEGRLG
jgi:N-acylglucosamine 2-epimerase/mannose-6-phosphate isomerase